jgi:hypothetical protein
VKAATKRKITEAGRAELARTGALNLPHAREVRHQRQETTMQASVCFQEGLAKEIGKTASASRQALIVSATTSYTALFAVLDRLRTARNAKQITALIDLLRPLQSGLLRSLQALGVTTKDADDDRSAADQAALDSLLSGLPQEGRRRWRNRIQSRCCSP